MKNNETPQENDELFNYDFVKMIKEKQVKTKFKNAAMIVGIPYIICFTISKFWLKIYLISASSLGISREEAINFVNGEGVNRLIQIFLSVFLFTVPFILSVIISGRTVSQTVSLSKPRKMAVLPCLLLGLSFCLFSNVAVSYAGGIFESFGIDYNVNFGTNPNGFFGIMLSFISISVVPALVEEFAFRGVIFGILSPLGDSFAVFSTAVLFGIMHGNFEQIPFALLVGLILGFVRVNTGSLWIPVIIHFSNNFISVCVDYLRETVSTQLLNFYYTFFVLIAILLFIPALIIFEKRFEKNVFNIEKGDIGISEKKKFKIFFTSPAIIVSIALYIWEAIKYFI